MRWAVSALLVLALVASSAEGSGSAVPDGVIVSVVTAPVRHYPFTRSWLEASTLAGADRRRLTPRPPRGQKQLDSNPAIAPDGKTVAFARQRPSGSSLWVIGRDGSSPRMLVRPSQFRALFGSVSIDDLVWSDDGSKLMASLFDSTGDGCRDRGLISVTLDSPIVEVLVRLKRGTDATLLPAGWSPDGTRIAYVTKYNYGECRNDYEGKNVISVASADGSHQRRLVTTGVTTGISWSPDGTRLAYASNCDQICNLFLIAPDGSQRRRVTAFEDNGTGIDAYVALPFAWWQGRLLYARRLGLFTFDPNTGKTSKLRRLLCPRLGRCKDWTSPPEPWLDGLSSDTAVFDVFTEDLGTAIEAAPLPRGPVTRLPHPRPLRQSDSVDYYVVALSR